MNFTNSTSFVHNVRYIQSVLPEYLKRMGIDVDPAQWKGPGSYYAWMRDMPAMPREIEALIPPGDGFILVD